MKNLAFYCLVAVACVGCGKYAKVDVSTGSDAPVVKGEKPVESASPEMAGWNAVKASKFSISLPKEWKSVDLTSGDLDKMIAGLELKPEMASQIKGLAKAGMFKLFAFAPDEGKNFRDNLNVIAIPTTAALPEVFKANVDQMSSSGMKIDKSELMKSPDRGVVWSHQEMNGQRVETYTSIHVHGGNYYTFTFSSSPNTKSAVQEIAGKACESIVFE